MLFSKASYDAALSERAPVSKKGEEPASRLKKGASVQRTVGYVMPNCSR